MNPPTHRDPTDIPADEWQAQEDARRAERLGLANDDPRLDEYRRIARALRQSLPDPLPADFAERVARRAGRRRRPTAWQERLLGPVLLGALLVAGVPYALDSLETGWRALIAHLPPGTLTSPWLPGLAVAVGLSAALGAVLPADLSHLWHRRG